MYAPHWHADTRRLIIGLTQYANKGHIARTALEAIAYNTFEVLEAMKKDANIDLNLLKVDGGMARNDLLMQFQANVLEEKVVRPIIIKLPHSEQHIPRDWKLDFGNPRTSWRRIGRWILCGAHL